MDENMKRYLTVSVVVLLVASVFAAAVGSAGSSDESEVDERQEEFQVENSDEGGDDRAKRSREKEIEDMENQPINRYESESGHEAVGDDQKGMELASDFDRSEAIPESTLEYNHLSSKEYNINPTSTENSKEISDWYDLDEIRDDLNGTYLLANDLNETTDGYDELVDTADGWEPIAPADEKENTSFKGLFDGQNHTISNIWTDRDGERGGGSLFGDVGDGGIIKNVGIEDANMTGGVVSGILVADLWGGALENCYTKGEINSEEDAIGGLVGQLRDDEAHVYSSYSIAMVNGNKRVGGLVGNNHLGTVENSYANGNVTGDERVGGLIGRSSDDGLVSNSWASGDVVGTDYVGGLLGSNPGTIASSYATGNVSGTDVVGGLAGISEKTDNSHATGDVEGNEWVGGLVGEIRGKVNNSHAIGNVNGSHQVGGLIGRNSEGNVSESYATGEVFGESWVGGLVGSNRGTIDNSSSFGDVNGTDSYIGGLAGVSDFVYNSYASGNVSGVNRVGGFVGRNDEGEVLGSYAEGEVSGDWRSGGLIGGNTGTVSNSYAIGNVNGSNYIGGLVGWNKGTVNDSYATVNVKGDGNVGGLVGENYRGTVKNSHYNIDEVLINGGHHITIGGLFDGQYKAWIGDKNLDVDNYSDSLEPAGEYYEISGSQGFKDLLGFAWDDEYKFCLANNINLSGEPGLYIPYLGADFDGNGYTVSNLKVDLPFEGQIGMFGYTNGGIVSDIGLVNVYVNGTSDVGGLVGWNNGAVKNSYATGNVSGNQFHVGGLVGYNHEGTVENSYATVNVNGSSDVGGLVGDNSYKGTVENSYATGKVDGDSNVGGLVGLNYGYDYEGTVKNSFWDLETSGEESSDGGTGKTNTEMKDITTYTDTDTEGLDEPWDFVGNPHDDDSSEDIWYIDKDEKINEGYPFLSQDIEQDTTRPVADAGSDKTVTIDEQFTLNGLSSSDNVGIVNYTWVYDGNEFYGSEITHSFSSTGTYQFKFNVTDIAGNYDTDIVNITVEEDQTDPTADASVDKTTIAIGENVNFDASGSTDNVGIESYFWEFGDGNTESGQTTSHTYDSPGEYTVTLNVTDSAGNHDLDTLTITVEDQTDPRADASANKTTVSIGESLNFDASASSDNVGIVSYKWDLDNGDTKTGEQINYTYDEPGNYTVELTVIDEAGNNDTDTVEITVEESDGGDGDDGGENGGGGTPGFTSLILLTATIIAVAIYQKKSKDR